jgi:acetyl esterase
MSDDQVLDEGVLDPAAVAYFEANPWSGQPIEEYSPEIFELARGPVGAPPSQDIAYVHDHVVEGIPVRFYRNDGPPTGLIVYFHGGAHCIGSIGLMDNVAREIAHATNAVVISVEYGLAPEHPFPAGLDDCETVTRWALAHAEELGVSSSWVAVAGESAGGNMSAAVTLRLRGNTEVPLAAQVLIYPAVDGNATDFPSRTEFEGIVLTKKGGDMIWGLYSGGRDISKDPFAAPLHAPSLADLPPAIVVLGGCDFLRDEGRAYAARLRDEGVEVDEVCYPGQPHGFVNFNLPAAAQVFERIGAWLPPVFERAGSGDT